MVVTSVQCPRTVPALPRTLSQLFVIASFERISVKYLVLYFFFALTNECKKIIVESYVSEVIKYFLLSFSSGANKSSGTEPVNYNYLPQHSILRGVINHLLAAKTSLDSQPG